MNDELISGTERVAVVVLQLAQGKRMTTREVSQRTGMTISGAHRMLLRISGVIPLARADGTWYLLNAPLLSTPSPMASIAMSPMSMGRGR